MSGWLYRWGPAITVMVLIFLASSASGSDLPDFGKIDFLVMNGGHLLGYALLGAAFLHGLSFRRPDTRTRLAAAVVLAILYAVSDEWHQSLTPGRYPALTDLFIDAAGALAGVALMHFIKDRRRNSPDRNT